MKSILDPSFRYISSVETDLKKTFARVRREQRRTGVDMETKARASDLQLVVPKKKVSA